MARWRIFKPAGSTSFKGFGGGKVGGYAILVVGEFESKADSALWTAIQEDRAHVIAPAWGGRCHNSSKPPGYVFATGKMTIFERSAQYTNNTMVFMKSWMLGLVEEAIYYGD